MVSPSRASASGRRLVVCCCAALALWLGAARAASMFEGVDIASVDGATVVRVQFVGRMRLQSYTPRERGSELRLLIRALSEAEFDPAALFGRETRGWPVSEPHPLRDLSYDGASPSGRVLTLQFRRAVSFTVRTTPDLQTLVVTLEAEPGAGRLAPRPSPPPRVAPPLPTAEPKPAPEPKPAVIRRRLYVIYLRSSRQPIRAAAEPRVPEFGDKKLFSTEAMVKGVMWNRLALGYFETLAEARSRLAALRRHYSGAWIGSLEVEERRAPATASRPPSPPAPAPTPEPAPAPVQAEGAERTQRLMEAGRRAMLAGEYSAAVQLYTEVLESPHQAFHQEARELLGLARERNGQFAHAIAEYEEYLRRYPEGKDAERVRQRLAGLLTARPSERELQAETLAEQAERKRAQVRWDWFGSLSQDYFRDETIEAATDAEIEVRQSTLTTFVALSGRRRGPQYDFRTRVTAQHQEELEDENAEPGEIEFTDLNVELSNRRSRMLGRLGRQRQSGSGLLGRFDGALLSVPASDRVTVSAVLGHPVDLSEKTTVQTEKTFFGLSANFGPYAERWNFNLFAIEQRADDFLDRQAMGGEARYSSPRHSAFALVDYDISYEELNSFLFLGNWTLSEKQTLYLNLDYRFSPVLTTSNALVSQPVSSLEELTLSFSEEEIRALALDRSPRTTLVSLGGSRQLTEDLQISLDVSASETEATPASGGVAATEATGVEYLYTLQFIGTNYLRDSDTTILSLRLGESATTRQAALSFDSRWPLLGGWRVNPRLLFDYREQIATLETSLRVRPALRVEYQGWRKVELQAELGVDWLAEDDGLVEERTTGYFFSLGYRWDF